MASSHDSKSLFIETGGDFIGEDFIGMDGDFIDVDIIRTSDDFDKKELIFAETAPI